MVESITAAVLHEPMDLRIEEVPMPRPGPDDVLVRMRSVGVCGSDVHYWRVGRIGPYVVEKPIILGHECAGEVVEVGANVGHLKPGDRVALEPGVPDRRCIYCRTGRYNLCPNVVFMATPPVDGAFVEYLVHPGDFCYRLDPSLSFEEGAMLEPLSVGLYAARRGGVGPGSSVLISGAGPVGLMTIIASRVAGATTIVAADLMEHRLELARRMGATHTFAPGAELAGQVRELTDGLGPEVVIDCSGARAAVLAAVEIVRRGGTVVLTGMGAESFEFPVITVTEKELDVKGHFRYVNTWPTAIGLVQGGLVDLKPLATHRFPLQEVVAALDLAERGADGAVKVLVTP